MKEEKETVNGEKHAKEIQEDIQGTYTDEQTKKEMGVIKKQKNQVDDERMHC